jgi:uncharacterized protein
MTRMRVVSVLFVLLPLLLAPMLATRGAAGPLYRWVDERGETHVTDDPQTIPERYRSSAGASSTAPSPASETGDSLESRRAAADRYLAAVPVDAMVAESLTRLAAQMPEGQRQQFVDSMTRLARRDSITGIAREGLARHFTVREIDALARFYGSPEGRSIMQKSGAYVADVVPAIQAEIVRVTQEGRQQ